MRLAAVYYDGRQAKPHQVTVSLEGDVLQLQGVSIERRDRLSALDIPPPLGNAPRLILFADGGRCEVADNRGFEAMLPAKAGSWVSGLENSWPYAVLSLLITLGLAAAAYLWGLPYAASVAADRMPPYMTEQLDKQFFASLDGIVLKPTELALPRRQAISDRLKDLILPERGIKPGRVEFRSSEQLGANAFALPGGSVVVLDQLVELSDNDDEIIAVLAHEMGHVGEKHALRQMLQASVVGLAMTWYIGDISSLMAAAPAALLETRYSRELERAADAFAAKLLRLNEIPVGRLADMLEKLEAAHRTDHLEASERVEGALDYFSSHPNTEERIKALRSR